MAKYARSVNMHKSQWIRLTVFYITIIDIIKKLNLKPNQSSWLLWMTQDNGTWVPWEFFKSNQVFLSPHNIVHKVRNIFNILWTVSQMVGMNTCHVIVSCCWIPVLKSLFLLFQEDNKSTKVSYFLPRHPANCFWDSAGCFLYVPS